VLLNSPLHGYAQIQLALNLDSLDRTDEAKASLEKVIAANPSDLDAIMALGNVLRGRKQFAECADIYSKGVDTIGNPEKSNWVIYIIFAASASSAPSSGPRLRPISRGRSIFFPINCTCSTTSAIRGSTRASISTRACA
jgi:tetratricopeptide (TPR) repeat protein